MWASSIEAELRKGQTLRSGRMDFIYGDHVIGGKTIHYFW
jgi:hypothetical protein